MSVSTDHGIQNRWSHARHWFSNSCCAAQKYVFFCSL